MTFIHIGAARQDSRTQYHNGLPQGWNRDRFRQLCVRYAQIQGCNAECVRTLEIIIDLVSPTAFTDTNMEPCCFARQDTLLGERPLRNRTVRRHEAQLEQIGLIDRRLGANGSRCKRKKLGLYLTPALDMIPDMMAAVEALRARHATWRSFTAAAPCEGKFRDTGRNGDHCPRAFRSLVNVQWLAPIRPAGFHVFGGTQSPCG